MHYNAHVKVLLEYLWPAVSTWILRLQSHRLNVVENVRFCTIWKRRNLEARSDP